MSDQGTRDRMEIGLLVHRVELDRRDRSRVAIHDDEPVAAHCGACMGARASRIRRVADRGGVR